MSNNSQTSKKGYGKPIIWIQNKLNEDVLIPDAYEAHILRPLGEYVTSFKYKYDEENDDECTITCGFKVVHQLDNGIFNEDVVLKVQWGYIEPGGEVIKSPVRTVAIRDIATSYEGGGIKLVLNCTDLVAYLNKVRSTTKSSSNNFMDWLQEIARGEFKATVRLGNDVMAIEKDHSRGFKYSEDGFLFAMDNARVFKKNFKDIPDLFKKFGSKSIKAELLERLDMSEAGPAYLDGRDNNINVIVRNFDQAPWVTFTVGGGYHEVISFRAKSNMAKVKENESQSTSVNPETKAIETTNTNTASPNPDNGEFTSESIAKVYSELEAVWEHNIMNPTDMKPIPAIMYKKTQDTGAYASDSNQDENTRVWTGLNRKELKVIVPSKTIINSPGFKELEKQAIARNYMMRKIERKFEASISVIGDPSLITSKIYEFLGLSKRDNGSWYIVQIEHDISSSRGYICNMTAVRKPQMLGIQYLKKKTSVISVGGEMVTETKKEVTQEKKYEKKRKVYKKADERKWENVKSSFFGFDKSASTSKPNDQVTRLSIINAEEVAINSTPKVSQEVDILRGGVKPNIENV